MKILHVISSGGMYGAESVILNLSRTLNRNGHASVLGVFSNTSNPNLQLHEAATGEGIESHLIPCNGQIDRAVATGIRQLAKTTGADVVHAHGYKADVYTYFALRGLRIPLVSTCHTWYDNDAVVRIYGMIDRFILRRYAGVVAVSDEVMQRLLKSKVRLENIHMIKNGIDLRPFDVSLLSFRMRDECKDPLSVGLVGRLAREKGIDIFVRATARVLAKCPNAKFVVVGDGPDLEALTALANELKIGEELSFVGRKEDMPSVYASLDVMVSSSRQEGLPMAILEGMASSLPLVATAVGEIPIVIRDGSTGILVPPEDVELLAAGIIRLLQDSALRKRLGIDARKLIETEFSAERMAKDYLRVYDEVISSGEANQLRAVKGHAVPAKACESRKAVK